MVASREISIIENENTTATTRRNETNHHKSMKTKRTAALMISAPSLIHGTKDRPISTMSNVGSPLNEIDFVGRFALFRRDVVVSDPMENTV